MKKLIYSFFSIILWLHTSAQSKAYYVSPAGSDNNSGLSSSSPWQSIAKVNSHKFQPGDRVLFKGGESYDGNLVFQHDDNGTPEQPVIINTYGSGKAILRADVASYGIYLYNCGGIEINNLVLEGNGAANNTHSGIKIYMDDTQTGDLSHIYLDSLEVKGFGDRGITVSTWDYPTEQTIVGGNVATKRSFHDVRITHSAVHDNGYAGIYSEGDWPNTNHTGLYIGYCSIYNNKGIPTLMETNSGSGIMISGFDGGLIEYSEAYNNGEWGQGSIGMWVFDAKNIIIQYCESHHNKTAASMDGGGFDIDGGAQNCIIQYCYSHDNEGAGFALFEYGSPTPFKNNVIRYNISQNDGRKNGYGGLAFWSGSEAYKIVDCEVYNNTVYMSKEGVVNGTPAAIKFSNNYMVGLKISNNCFYVADDLYLVHSQAQFNPSMIHFQGNNYYSATGNQHFVYGVKYNSLYDWMAAAPGQEVCEGQSVGIAKDPLFLEPGGGGIVHPSDGGDLTTLTAYRIRSGSPLIDAGVSLKSAGLDIGSYDFYNTPLKNETIYDIGAHEYDIDAFTVLPLQFIGFGAAFKDNSLAVTWAMANTEGIDVFYVEVSNDGQTFKPLSASEAENQQMLYRYNKKISGNFQNSLFCRIKAVAFSGKVYYSETKKVSRPEQSVKINLFPNPATSIVQVQLKRMHTFQTLILRNSLGQPVMQKILMGQTENVSLHIENLKSGIYFVELARQDGGKETQLLMKQ